LTRGWFYVKKKIKNGGMMGLEKKLLDLVTRKEKARLAGGEKRIASQHEKGKYTARERIEKILDAGSLRNSTCSSPTAATTSTCRRTSP
jgi:acetyl-CoA carboxylase carboxyltransferase component